MYFDFVIFLTDIKPMPKVEKAFSEIFKNSLTSPISSSITSALSGDTDHKFANLPENVDVSETTLFWSRSKLYCLDKGTKLAWTDRGVGNVKIISNKTTGRFRVVMRREEDLKVRISQFLDIFCK